MVAKKETKKGSDKADKSELGFWESLKEFKSKMEKKKKENDEKIELVTYYTRPFYNAYRKIKQEQAEKEEAQKERLAEIEKAKQEEENKKERAAILQRLDTLVSFHKQVEICDLKYFLRDHRMINPEQKDAVYEDILNGGEWFWRFVRRNIRYNFNKELRETKLHYRIDFKDSSLSDNHRELWIIMPSYKDFNPTRYIESNGKKIIPPEYLDKDSLESLYKNFMYSILFQAISVVFECVDYVSKQGGKNLIDTLTTIGKRNLFDDSFGKDKPYSVISVTITKDDYSELNPSRMNPESVLNRLGAEIYTDLFYTDIYEPELIKTTENTTKKRSPKKTKKEQE